MAAKPKPMNQIKQILRLYSLGVPVKRIARELGVARNTVKRYVSMQNSSPHDLAELDEVQFHEHATPGRAHTDRQRRVE
jgi:predicted transcriptional regulator